MRRLVALPLILGCLLVAGCGSSQHGVATAAGLVQAPVARASAAAPGSDVAALDAGDATFAAQVLATLARGQPNVALSPFSISEVMSMVYEGAHGTTASQIAHGLDFALAPDRLAAAMNTTTQDLEGVSGGGVRLSLADALYGQTGQRFRAEFLNLLARYYGTGVRVVDFAHTQSALSAVNGWVSQQTHGRITNLLGPSDIGPFTRLVRVNAVYLKAAWASPFAPQATSPQPFHAPGGVVQVPTMYQNGQFAYESGPGFQALELPYRGGRLAFDVLLPDPGRLDTVLSSLAAQGPSGLLSSLNPAQVDVSLPKFKLTTHLEMKQTMAALGVRQVFDPGLADLSGIAGAPGDLSVQALVHEAYISVDEAGTVAAAATAATVTTSAAPGPQAQPIQFDVDRPFVFVLRDLGTGTVLFEGVVSNPASAG